MARQQRLVEVGSGGPSLVEQGHRALPVPRPELQASSQHKRERPEEVAADLLVECDHGLHVTSESIERPDLGQRHGPEPADSQAQPGRLEAGGQLARFVEQGDGAPQVAQVEQGVAHPRQGERLVQKELRRTLLKYKLHTDQELFDKAYGYIRQYY